MNHQSVIEAIEKLSNTIKTEANTYIILPPMPDMFKAFNVPLNEIKAVILGQDPTPQPGKATGLAFSVEPGVDPFEVPSIYNMLIELGWERMKVGLKNGDLTPWLGQGVLLLNSALTVRQGEAGIYVALWRNFTALLVSFLSRYAQRTAWILWGKPAKSFAQYIDQSKHYIKEGAHPSPQAALSFFGGNYFICANEFLDKARGGGINWEIPSQGKRPIEKC